MKIIHSLRLLLLLPAVFLTLMAAVLVYSSLSTLQRQHGSAELAQDHDLAIIVQAGEFSRQVGLVQQQMHSALSGAVNQQLSELQLYRVHSRVVNQLHQLKDSVRELSKSQLVLDANHGSATGLHEAFEQYQRFVIMTTDVLAVDPQVAQEFLHQAQQQYLNFSIFTSSIEILLAQRAQTRNQEQKQIFNQLINRMLWLSLAALMAFLLAIILFSRRASKNLLLITEALATLFRSSDSKIDLPHIEKMYHQSSGELKRIARTLLDFRHALERQHAAEEQAFQLAFYDPLTGLPNRRLLNERIRQAHNEFLRYHQLAALLIFDINDFKNINESHGYTTGDQVLQATAVLLNELLQPTQTAARLTSNTFAILVPGLDAQNSQASKQVRDLVDGINLALSELTIEQQKFYLSASFGVSLLDTELKDLDTLVTQAEAAMFRAKACGRGTLLYFDSRVQAKQQKRLALENDLRQAIELQQLQLFYQLQVNEHARPVGVEALLRWFHPERGMVSPGEFIPLAEASDLILPIGDWVLLTACQQLAAWQQRPGCQHLSIAVNVSARQFRQADFTAQVRQALSSTTANPHLLKLELTESIVLEDVENTIAKMEELRRIGVRFSIDDFGTGYSSLMYLKRLPLDQLKIEQSFAREVTSNKNDAAIVQTIIAMGRALDLEVIAEGVETMEQQQFLQMHGCSFYQGYLYSKPMPINDLENLLY